MRVLFWTGTFWPKIGGVEVLAQNLIPSLQKRGYEFIIISTKTEPEQHDESQYNGIPVYRFPFWDSLSYKNLALLIQIKQKIVKLKAIFAPELVHINAVGIDNFFHMLTNDSHSPSLLVTLHGEWLSGEDGLVSRTLRDANWVVGCSAAIIEKGRQLVPEIYTHSSIIHNALEVPGLTPESLLFDEPRLLCLGRLSHEKGFDLAMTAFGKVVSRFPKTRLIIAGDGEERVNLEREIKKIGLTDFVELVGWVAPEEVPRLINSCTMVVVPSRKETFGLAALESALMGRPVVATGVGGLPEVVVHEQTGLLVENENSDALAEGVLFLLNNPEAARQMGQRARCRAIEKFSWDQYVDSYDALYKKLIRVSQS